MRVSPLLATVLPLLALAACGSPAVVKDSGSPADDLDDLPGAPEIALDTFELDLGGTSAGTPVSGTFTVTNEGDAALSVALTVAEGSQSFAVDVESVDVAPGGSQVVQVTFVSPDEGAAAAVIQVASNDVDEPLLDVDVTALVEAVADGDADDDGWVEGEDCDDADADVYPGADEVWYDGVDGDCDGRSDYDADGDGSDSAAYGGDDCDDTEAAVHPGTSEVAGDGIDNDCDGEVDEALSTVDADGDGWSEADGDCNDADASVNPGAVETWYDGVDADCNGASDYDADYDGSDSDAWGGGDCDDSDAAVGPAMTEVVGNGIDDDCDGDIDGLGDADGDGYTEGDGDCDDADASVNPGAVETWYDGIDQDCDGRSDDDQDGDGYDSADYGGTDCDDTDAAVSPGTFEVAGDGVDNDCDGTVDEDLSRADLDGDGWSEVAGDCNDTDATVYPGAAETWYDGVDGDCDGASDYDQDGDGYDSADYGGTDCDDTDASVSPAATEVWYDGIDSDCSGGSDDDQDGDGYDSVDYGGTDCDDTDASVYVGAAETWYDGVDSDCDGASDYDQDGDGFDSAAYGGDDCDDTDAAVNPGATEVWYDGVDADCDGSSDYDQDGDGFDSAAYGGDDCDDTDAAVNPAAAEVWYDGVDADCDGSSDYDQDGDGFDSAAYGGTDCDDTDATVNPAAAEVWYDGVDQDCDGASDYDRDGDGDDSSTYGGTDCNDLDPTVHVGATETWYDGVDTDCSGGSDYDQDGDGYTTSAYGGLDCDDTDATVSPAATEIWYDGTDQDCSGGSDYDQDGDGYTTSAYGGLDCDDTDAAVSPAATEACDGVDNDCDGTVDDGVTTTYYLDADTDGYGLSSSTTAACSLPSGYTATSGDCDDGTSTVYPGATEVCDGVDQDCDGTVDDGVTTTYYLDADSDGYGLSSSTSAACSVPSGYSGTAGDCDDGTSTVYPGATEVCDGVDQDCDGTVDDGVLSTWYLDSDGDGYGTSATTSSACSAPSGYVSDATDCNDGDATAYPGASEIAYDVSDNDCDGYQDDMVAADESGWTVLGESSSDAIGNAVYAEDDLDGDGNPELVIGAQALDYSGSWSTYSDIGALSFHDVDDSAAAAALTDGYLELYGNSSDDYLGTAFAVVDDLDGDGDVEFAVGAHQNDVDNTDDGTVYLLDINGWSGAVTTSSYDDGAVYGTSGNGYFGYALAAGDFDGDGTNDLATGAPGEQSAKGRVYVSFQDDNLADGNIDADESSFYVTGVSSSDHLGYSVAFGDFGGDGYDDLVACSPDDDDNGSGSGTCWVIDGSSSRDAGTWRGTTVSSIDSAVITGAAASDQLGLTRNSLSVGDLDGDGADDLAVGVPGYDGGSSGGGGVWVYLAGTLSGSETVSTASYVALGDGTLGTAVNMTGDVTGDGTVDLLAGATTAGSGGEGMVYLLEGGLATGTYTLPTDQYASWVGEAASDAFGTAISGLRDLDGDGRYDFAVSAPGNDDGASGAGKVYVIPAYP